MTRLIATALTALALGTTPALACTEADVLGRQDALVNAIQALLATDPAKAQAIVENMQAKMDAAVEAGNTTASCEIIDNAIAEATG